MSKTVPFQTIQFSISMNFKSKYTVQLSKTFLFQAIQFSQFSLASICRLNAKNKKLKKPWLSSI